MDRGSRFVVRSVKIEKGEAFQDVALDLYPCRIFKGKVENIRRGSGEGQMLPSGSLEKGLSSSPGISCQIERLGRWRHIP